MCSKEVLSVVPGKGQDIINSYPSQKIIHNPIQDYFVVYTGLFLSLKLKHQDPLTD